MSADEDTELRDLVAQTLEANGVLGKIRAQLRSSVFLALEEQESIRSKQPFVNKDFQKFISTKEGRVTTALVREFLEHFGLEFTVAVFDPETGFKDEYEGRESLSRELNIVNSNEPPDGPLLAQVVRTSADPTVSRSKHGSSDHDSFQYMLGSEAEYVKIPKDLTSRQIADARKKFAYYDKDNSGYIDKDELRNLFTDMFPHFHRNMLERYVNDEFRAVDRDFSNGIEFDEFLAMYKRLFILCKSVVSQDVAEIIPNSPTKKMDTSHSKIPSAASQKTTNSSMSPPSSLSIDTKNKRNLEADKSAPTSKHQANGLIDLGSDPEDDPFFDDPPPKPAKQYASGTANAAPVNLAKSGSGTVGMSSLKDLPALGEKSGSSGLGNLRDAPPLPGMESKKKQNGKPSDLEKDIKAIDRRIADLGFDVPEDDDYDDDFITSSGISKLSARSEKSENKSMSIAEEIDEEIDEDISGVDDLLKSSHSGFDDLTQDQSISIEGNGGFDYVEDVKQ
ncbi:centrosomal protein 43-like isoform X2 [Lineus longissimus]|uniref:centrosomal protein 43-like isoform X2 n=1 Tax=Lineus longissimus TaxID=88925 RepID=UPI00315D3866